MSREQWYSMKFESHTTMKMHSQTANFIRITLKFNFQRSSCYEILTIVWWNKGSLFVLIKIDLKKLGLHMLN